MRLTDAQANAATFGREWRRFDYASGVTWGRSVEARMNNVLRLELCEPPEWFAGKRLLDAGCGHGVVSNEFAKLGARVTAIDVSPSVHVAREQYPSVRFYQCDLFSEQIPNSPYDAIYAGGVLHHTPNTQHALRRLLPALAPGGRIYVWLYWDVPGIAYRLKKMLRKLPSPMRRALVWPFALQGWQRNRTLPLSVHWLAQHDFFTPRYRWEHTPEEVIRWFEDAGLQASLGPTTRDGFGVLAIADQRHPYG